MSQPRKPLRPARRITEGPRPHPIDYSPQEEEALVALYPAAPRAQILAAIPGRDWCGIQRAAARRDIRRPRLPNYTRWAGNPIEQLRARYVREGASALAKELGFSESQVRAQASAEGLRRASSAPRRPAKRAPKRETAEQKAARVTRLAKLYPKKAVVAVVKVVKAAKEVKPTPPPVSPAKRSPSTPLLNAQKAATQAAKKAALAAKASQALVPASTIQALPYTHPARMAYMLNAKDGGHAASRAYHEAMRIL